MNCNENADGPPAISVAGKPCYSIRYQKQRKAVILLDLLTVSICIHVHLLMFRWGSGGGGGGQMWGISTLQLSHPQELDYHPVWMFDFLPLKRCESHVLGGLRLHCGKGYITQECQASFSMTKTLTCKYSK